MFIGGDGKESHDSQIHAGTSESTNGTPDYEASMVGAAPQIAEPASNKKTHSR